MRWKIVSSLASCQSKINLSQNGQSEPYGSKTSAHGLAGQAVQFEYLTRQGNPCETIRLLTPELLNCVPFPDSGTLYFGGWHDVKGRGGDQLVAVLSRPQPHRPEVSMAQR